MITFEQNLDLFILKFKQTQHSSSKNFNFESIENQTNEEEEEEDQRIMADHSEEQRLTSSQKIRSDSLNSSGYQDFQKHRTTLGVSNSKAHFSAAQEIAHPAVKQSKHRRYQT
jgi:hypothetical protein